MFGSMAVPLDDIDIQLLTALQEDADRTNVELARRNLSELEPPRLYYLLTSSHPTPAERIRVARSGGRVPAA